MLKYKVEQRSLSSLVASARQIGVSSIFAELRRDKSRQWALGWAKARLTRFYRVVKPSTMSPCKRVTRGLLSSPRVL